MLSISLLQPPHPPDDDNHEITTSSSSSSSSSTTTPNPCIPHDNHHNNTSAVVTTNNNQNTWKKKRTRDNDEVDSSCGDGCGINYEFTLLSQPLLLPQISMPMDSTSNTVSPVSSTDSVASLTTVDITGQSSGPQTVAFPLRIMKTDIRRQYPIMLVNAINSGDSQMVLSFLDRYGNNNHRNNHYYHSYMNRQYHSSQNTSLHTDGNIVSRASFPLTSYIHGTSRLPVNIGGLSLLQCNLLGNETTVFLHGKDPIAMYFDCMMNLMPDYILRLYDIKVKTSSSYPRDWCRLEFIFCLEGTKLYSDVDPGCIGKNVHDQLNANAPIAPTAPVANANIKDHIRYFRDYSGQLPVYCPRKQVVHGMIMLLVNHEKQIERIEILGAPRYQ